MKFIANQPHRYVAALMFAVLFRFPPQASAQLTTLRLGTNAPASTEAVLFSVAREAGVLRQHQFDVEVIYIAGGTLAMQALIGRSLDFLCTGGTPFILAYLEGAPAKIIAGVHNRLPYALIANPGITTAAQLRGRKSVSAASAAPMTTPSSWRWRSSVLR